jgi:hypothetical protein
METKQLLNIAGQLHLIIEISDGKNRGLFDGYASSANLENNIYDARRKAIKDAIFQFLYRFNDGNQEGGSGNVSINRNNIMFIIYNESYIYFYDFVVIKREKIENKRNVRKNKKVYSQITHYEKKLNKTKYKEEKKRINKKLKILKKKVKSNYYSVVRDKKTGKVIYRKKWKNTKFKQKTEQDFDYED